MPGHQSSASSDTCTHFLQALQCLVNILRSLVEWYTAGMPAEQPVARVTTQSASEDNVQSWENLTSSGPSQLFAEAPAEDGSPMRQTLRRDTSVLQSVMMNTGNQVCTPLPPLYSCRWYVVSSLLALVFQMGLLWHHGVLHLCRSSRACNSSSGSRPWQ